VAHADLAETKGGIKVKTDDGRFEMSIGGRIHFDAYSFSPDDEADFGSSALNNRGGTAFRREYLTLTGKLYGWKYKYEHDFAAEGGTVSCNAIDIPADPDLPVDPAPFTPSCSVSNGGFGASGNREMWVSTTLGPGEIIIGQFKPFRGMEELTSSNEITMMERPVTTASGVYNGRQFLMGLGYKGIVADQFGYGIDLMQLGGSNTTTEGLSYGARFYWFPMAADGGTIHIGLAYSIDSEDVNSVAATPGFTYGGRRGQSITFGNAGVGGCSNGDVSACGDQSTLALELGASFGPITLQAEYAKATLEDAFVDGVEEEDADVTAYYVQASWFMTGEKKVYKKDRGAFGSPKPNGAYGAWELAARMEYIESDDEDENNSLCAVSGVSGAAAADKCEVEQVTVGLNWYVNPNVRFMLNYYLPKVDLGGTEGKDEPDAVSLRTQLSF
jgi:phosphate-selective porin OprO/OprP